MTKRTEICSCRPGEQHKHPAEVLMQVDDFVIYHMPNETWAAHFHDPEWWVACHHNQYKNYRVVACYYCNKQAPDKIQSMIKLIE